MTILEKDKMYLKKTVPRLLELSMYCLAEKNLDTTCWYDKGRKGNHVESNSQ